jgi:hypothetical protein
MMGKFIYFLFIPLCWGCIQVSDTEKYQGKRDNVINIREKMKEMKFDNVLIGPIAPLYVIGDYLFIIDAETHDRFIHIFNKNTLDYVTSTAYRGQGPDEITRIGHIAFNERKDQFFVTDHGKQKIFSYELDSVLVNPSYTPNMKRDIDAILFPDKYLYVNDTLSIGVMIEPIGNSDFKPCVAKWNMVTGEIKRMNYEHPDIDKKRISFAVSMDNGIYVECYSHYDLMTICSLDGELKYNIYGRGWNGQKGRIRYYGNSVAFCKDRIFALYSGEDFSFNTTDSKKRLKHPTKFLVFNLNGDYIKTLETGYQITYFCYDSENNRMIMSLDDEMQFAYLDLDEISM